jgi:hypothetical protein
MAGGQVVESFLPGRPGALKEWTEWLGQRRVLQYHVSARLDGLATREEEFGQKIIERFEDRPDHLVYRSVRLVQDVSVNKSPYVLQDAGPTSDVVVAKMTEKFARNKAKRAVEDMAKRTFYVAESRVRTVYHYDDPKVTRPAAVIYKDRANAVTVGSDDMVDFTEDSLQQASH